MKPKRNMVNLLFIQNKACKLLKLQELAGTYNYFKKIDYAYWLVSYKT